MELVLCFWFFPDANGEYKNRDDNYTTHGTQWTKYSDDEFLRDDIGVKEDSTTSETSEDFCWSCFRCNPTDERDESKNRIYHECYHRKWDSKYEGTRIGEDVRARKCRRNITWKHTKSVSIGTKPKIIRMP